MNDSAFIYKNRSSLTNIVAFAKRLLDICLADGGTYADFTMGNGHDTLYLAQNCPNSPIYAFDIQQEALDNTAKRLAAAGAGDNVHLILDSHENFDKYLPGRLDGGIFNLGFRPGGDMSVTTERGSTLTAIRKALEHLSPGGVVVVVVYPGHPEGLREGEAIQAFASGLAPRSYETLLHRIANLPDAPYIVAFGKKNVPEAVCYKGRFPNATL